MPGGLLVMSDRDILGIEHLEKGNGIVLEVKKWLRCPCHLIFMTLTLKFSSV